MAESRIVEIYEIETLSSGKWIPDPIMPWASKDHMPSRPADELQLPGSEWSWESNWRITKKPGGTDKDGWEYASRIERFSDPTRKSKPEKLWNDKSRRRLYTRVMRRDSRIGKVEQFLEAMPKIQKGLRSIYTVRVRIEQVIKQAPEAIHEPQMTRLLDTVRINMLETLNMLNTLDSSGLTAAQVAVIKKLRNDLQKEEAAIEKALQGTGVASVGPVMPARGHSFVGAERPPPPTGPHMQRGHSFATGSTTAGTSAAGIATRSPNPSRNGRNTPVGGAAKPSSSISGSMPTRSGSFLLGKTASSEQGGSSGGGGMVHSTSTGVVSGGRNVPLNLSFSSTGGGGVEDGMFVQRTEHESEISKKLVPVDHVEVNARIIEERAVAIEEIHKGLVEVNEMFNDLSRIIKEQQSEVDTIFSNCEESHAKTAEAFSQIVEADRLQQEACTIS